MNSFLPIWNSKKNIIILDLEQHQQTYIQYNYSVFEKKSL